MLSVVLALIFIVGGLSDLGWSSAFVRLGSPEVMRGGDLRQLNETFLTLRIALATALALVLAVAGRWILPTLRLSAHLSWLAWAAGLAGIVLAVGAHFTTAMQVARDQRRIAALRTLAGGLRLAAYVLLALDRGLRLSSALVVALAAIPVEAGLMAWGAHRAVRLWPPTLRRPPAAWLALSAWTAVPALAFTLIGQTDTVLLASLAGSAQTGLWNAAARIAGVVTLVSGSLWAVAFPYATGTIDRSQLIRYLRLARLAALAVAGACIVGIAAARWLTLLLYGDAFDGAIPTLRWLLAANALATGGVLLVPVAYRLGRERLVAGVALVQFTVNLGGDLMLIPRYGASGCAVATFVMHAATLAILLPASRAGALRTDSAG